MGSNSERTDSAETASRELVDYFRTQVGRNLHSVVEYDDASWERLYAREGVQSGMSGDDVDVLLRYVRSKATGETDAPIIEPNVGCSVWCFERAAVLHLTRSRGRNVVVTLEPEAASRLLSVVDDCRAILSSDR